MYYAHAGNPQTMQDSPRYGDVVSEVEFFLQRKVNEFRRSGISEDRILIDPGFGFGKTSQHNLSLLKEIPRLSRICPLLVGLSRKRIISELCKRKSNQPIDWEEAWQWPFGAQCRVLLYLEYMMSRKQKR